MSATRSPSTPAQPVAPLGPAAIAGAVQDVRQDFGAYALAGQYRFASALPGAPDNALPPVPLLALHGARSNLHRLSGLLAPLQQLGVGSLAPSLSGHGPDSPLPVEHTSLAQNLREALCFAQRLGPQLRMVFGSSLGGALALRVAEHCADRVRVLVLSGPALYPEAAWSTPHFGTPFRSAISQPFGFMDSRSLDFLRRFTGRVVLIQGEWDGLPATAHGAPAGRSAGEVTLALPQGGHRTVYSPIPAEVFEAIAQAAGPRLLHLTLAGTDHRSAAHWQQHPAVGHAVARVLHRTLQTALHPAKGAADGATPAGPQRLHIDTHGQMTPCP